MKQYTLHNDTVLTVRRARPEDADAIVAYLNMISYETNQLGFSGHAFGMSVEQEYEYLASIESGECQDIIITGWINDNLVAIANINRNTAPHEKHRGEMGISVRLAHQGVGVGSCLLSHIKEIARENNIEMLTLWVRTDNENAIALYRKYGFEVAGTLPCGHKHDGHVCHDLHIMYVYI